MSQSSKLPYVDGVPDGTQKRIPWIRNGDHLNASETQFGNGGTLNAVGVALNANILALEGQSVDQSESLKKAQADIEDLKDVVGAGNGADLILQVEKNTIDIADLKTSNTEVLERVDEAEETVKLAIDAQGAREINDFTTRSIFSDLYWIKTIIGNWDEEDVNENQVPFAISSGLKHRIISNAELTNQNASDIIAVNERITNLNLETVVQDVSELRNELGIQDKPGKVYSRLGSLETISGLGSQAIDEIKTKIDFSNATSVSERVSQNETAIQNLNDEMALNDQDIVTIKTRLDDHDTKLDELEVDLVSVKSSLGDSTSGVVKDLADLTAFVGKTSDPNPPEASLAGQVRTLSGLQNNTAATVQDIQIELQDTSEEVSKLKDVVNGTKPTGTIPEVGLIKTAESQGERISQLESGGAMTPKQVKSHAATTLSRGLESIVNINNLFDKEDVTVKTKLLADGTTSTSTNTSVSSRVLVDAGKFTTNFSSQMVCFYDVEGGFISSKPNVVLNVAFDVPEGATFARFTIDETKVETAVVVRGASAPSEYRSFGFASKEYVKEAVAEGIRDSEIHTPRQGETISWLFDSVKNDGFKSEVIANTKLVHKTDVVGGNGIHSLGLADLTVAMTSDLVVIHAGAADFLTEIDLGTIADAVDGYAGTQSFYNDLYVLLKKLTADNIPQVLFVTSTKFGKVEGYVPVYPAANSKGHKYEQYIKAICEVCEYFAVPVYDAFTKSGINMNNIAKFTTDKIHYNAAASKRLGRSIAAVINTI